MYIHDNVIYCYCSQTKPLVLIELKPSVSASLGNVNPSNLFQVLLDAYYVLKSLPEMKDIIVCLTDTVTWHFMDVRVEGTKLKSQSETAYLYILVASYMIHCMDQC